MYLYQRIEEMMAKHQDSRYVVGEFVLKEMDRLPNFTITEIAEATFTSKSTVVRFAKTLGYEGWKEFMRDFIAETRYQKAHQGNIDANYPFLEDDSTEIIIEKMKKLQVESIEDTAELLDVKMIEKAKRYLLGAERVLILGLSPNIFLGELFRRKMVTIGKSVYVATPGESGILSRTLQENDCAIMISYSGNNTDEEPLNHLPTLLENKVKVIGLTSGKDNYLRRTLDCVLTISTRERLYAKIANFATEESINFLLNSLFACYFAENYQKNCIYKIQNSSMIEKKRYASLSKSPSNDR